LVKRIRARDYTVWKEDPTEIEDRLGWLDLPETMSAVVPTLVDFAEEAAWDGFTRAVLLGMGGSSLAPEVMAKTFGSAAGALDLTVMDTTHPAAVASLTERLDLAHTLFVVASKSGTTIETRSHLDYFWSLAPQGAQFVAITDPGSELEDLAVERDFRAVFANPPDIGGRYSALSYFGLVPAALIGANLGMLLSSAREVADSDDPGESLGMRIGRAARAGRDKLTLQIAPEIASFGAWVEQLIAESTGKEGKGIVPVDGETRGAPEAYGLDREFVEVTGTGADLGALFFEWEFATAVAGHVLGIQPFDQPNVAEAKQATADALAAGASSHAEPMGDVRALLSQAIPGDYVAMQAFLDPTEDNASALQAARMSIRDRHRVATTLGFGPRYLHSTGQLHKGGPPTGVFIQVVDPSRDADVAIPDRPYTFGALIDAQATGDLRALRARDRRAVRTTLNALLEATT
jgi:hypothetical protein